MRKIGVFTFIIGFAALANVVLANEAAAASHGQGAGMSGSEGSMMGSGMSGPMLMMPMMNPANGRKLFASKGCVVCHAVNGIGGEDAPPLDASTMRQMMNPFEFAAKMWGGAEAMIYLQREELGEQVAFTGQELSDIIAFVHHPEEQVKFSEADIPPRILELIEHGHKQDDDAHDERAD
jgi:cytochrome c